jgi:hypothetical protein
MVLHCAALLLLVKRDGSYHDFVYHYIWTDAVQVWGSHVLLLSLLNWLGCSRLFLSGLLDALVIRCFLVIDFLVEFGEWLITLLGRFVGYVEGKLSENGG